MIIFNEDSDDIVEEKHICYYTKVDGDNIILKEVIEKKLKHPDAKESAYVYKIDTRFIHEFNRNELKASSVILLAAALFH